MSHRENQWEWVFKKVGQKGGHLPRLEFRMSCLLFVRVDAPDSLCNAAELASVHSLSTLLRSNWIKHFGSVQFIPGAL